MTDKAWYDYPDWNNFMQLWNNNPINGDDIAMPEGTPITSPFSGVVSKQYVDDSGGITIIKVDSSSITGGIQYYYVDHLDTFAPDLQVGSHVNAGDMLGTSGGQLSGGNFNASPTWSTGPHIMIGLSSFNGIPVGQQITPNLNPHWILAYAQQQQIPASSPYTLTLDSSSDSSQQTSCAPYDIPCIVNNAVNNAITNTFIDPVLNFLRDSGEKIAIFLLALTFIIIGIVLLAGAPELPQQTSNQQPTQQSGGKKKQNNQKESDSESETEAKPKESESSGEEGAASDASDADMAEVAAV